MLTFPVFKEVEEGNEMQKGQTHRVLKEAGAPALTEIKPALDWGSEKKSP